MTATATNSGRTLLLVDDEPLLLAASPKHGTNVQDLLKRADLAMYAAKESGRNGYRLYDTGLSG